MNKLLLFFFSGIVFFTFSFITKTSYALQCGGTGTCYNIEWICYPKNCVEGTAGCSCDWGAGSVNGYPACKSYDGYTCDPAACGGSSIPGTSNCYPINSQNTQNTQATQATQNTQATQATQNVPSCPYAGASADTVCSNGANFPACPNYMVDGTYTSSYQAGQSPNSDGCYVSWSCTGTYCGPTATPIPTNVPTFTPTPTPTNTPPGIPTNTPTPTPGQTCSQLHGPGDIPCGTCHDYSPQWTAGATGSCTDYGDGCCYGSPGPNPGTPTPTTSAPPPPEGCQTVVGQACQYWTADTKDINGNNIHATGVKKGTAFGAGNKLTVEPGQLMLFQADLFNILPPGGSCNQWSIDMRMNIVRTDQGNTLQSTCYENTDPNDNHAYYCDNGTPYVAFNDDPYKNSGFSGTPATTVLPYQDQCVDVGSNGTGGRKYKCGPCDINGNVSYCFRGSTTQQQGNDTYLHGPLSYNCTDPQTGEGEPELLATNACKVSGLDNYDPALHTYAQYADAKAKKWFETPGVYNVEYSGLKSGFGGGASFGTPCQIQVTVTNPSPPTGTITANPTTCVMTEPNSTCTSTISWTATNATNVKVLIHSDDSVFVPETTTTNGSQDAPWITANGATFDLYATGYSYPYSIVSSVTARGNPYINGDVYVDTNENGIQDAGESAWTGGGTVSINGSPTNLDASGHFVRLNLAPSSNPTFYTVALNIPAGYEATTPSTRQTSLSAPVSFNFGIAPLHTVSGRIFNDENKNKVFDTGDTGYGNTMVVQASLTDGTVIATTNSDGNGNYNLGNLPSGLLNISLATSLPTGYRVIWPVGTTPPTFTPQVGPSCLSGPLDTSTGASYINTSQCNIQDLNFAISNSIPWLQMIGSDGRFDSGINNGQFTNFVANTSACNSGYTLLPGVNSTPGVAEIGSSSRTSAFGGVGAGSANNWILGSPFPEYFTTFGSNPDATGQGLQTSYDYILNTASTSNITPTDLSTIAGCTDLSACTIASSLPNGIYKADGNLTLTGATFGSGKDYIILVNGDLTITGNITTPSGSTATFSVKRDIIVDKSVGASSLSCPTTATSGQIQGFFSADRSIIIDGLDTTGAGVNCSNGDGPDVQINVDGVLVANAGLGTGGLFNKRDLCAFNVTYPSLTVKERLDFVLNAPQLLKTQNYIYREVAP